MADGRAVVSLSAVHKRYGSGANQVVALDGVDLSFHAGTFTAVMGPSGSGKSTLLQCAAGLDRVDDGQVLLAGADPARMSETARTILRREKIGFIFQQFNLLPSLTARQNVELPLRLAGRPPHREDVDRVLADVSLGDRAEHLPSELSGGQQQRVAIARALVTGPEVLFADEPTGALDSRTSRDVLSLMRRIVAERGQTIVMVTHDPIAASYAGRAVFLADGRIVDQIEDPTAEGVAARMGRLEVPPC
ncbi:ABC transporter ATP-binding protein [Actinomadura harenae]|uniref:ABC transporter ATP-binding protein n=1 Tax=Actinomadura harenae TaxID=2483351 RepID=A0A3M2M8W0_9ACTN|nr:ABC transporter ATP-binding protein [Actinomadura harenae]RMI45480.1 ABC transporter ATP-binding protein [Actinomadura harenae]